MSIIRVGCELHYRVTAPTSFLFNIAVAHTTHQAVRQEHFTIDPHAEYIVENVGEEGNRVVRLHAKVGDLTLQYQATVVLEPEVEDPPTIMEAEHPALPKSDHTTLAQSVTKSPRAARGPLYERGRFQPPF